jgi:hypothetical protein
MHYQTLLEIVAAVHLASTTDSPFDQRGGMFLVAPPGSFKSTITTICHQYRGALILSDVNVQSLVKLKETIQGGEIKTLAFTDFGKLYKRNPAVAANIEGILMALADEGFRRASFQPQSVTAGIAKATIIGAMTSSFYESKVEGWMSSGFWRRFIFATYAVENPDIIQNAIFEQRFARLDGQFVPKQPLPAIRIPHKLTKEQLEHIDYISRHVMYREGVTVLLEKIYAVLIWKFGTAKARDIIKDFGPCLSKDGAKLTLQEEKERK